MIGKLSSILLLSYVLVGCRAKPILDEKSASSSTNESTSQIPSPSTTTSVEMVMDNQSAANLPATDLGPSISQLWEFDESEYLEDDELLELFELNQNTGQHQGQQNAPLDQVPAQHQIVYQTAAERPASPKSVLSAGHVFHDYDSDDQSL